MNVYASNPLQQVIRLARGLSAALLLIAAQQAAASGDELQQLMTMSLDQLVDVRVSLASRTEERAFAAPSAVYVITSEDIRRSGVRRLPELLRMVPGMHTGKLDASHWSVSSRNTQSRFSSTMLVMIDGRHIYTPLYGGVRWELQNLPLEDIERIEVIRGPGGTQWGANAVDGVINIITRKSQDTRGVLTWLGAGQGSMRAEAGARIGSGDADRAWRLSGRVFRSGRGEYLPADLSNHEGARNPGDSANDDTDAVHVGLRADWSRSPGAQRTFQANAYDTRVNEERRLVTGIFPNQARAHGINGLFRWQQGGNGNQFRLTLSLASDDYNDDILADSQVLGDVDVQYARTLGRHDLVIGGGYRYYHSKVEISDPAACSFTTPCFGLDPARRTDRTYNALVQDRVRLNPESFLIVGSKFEHNPYTGFEYQPTARFLYLPDEDSTAWVAVTRVVRTPTRIGSDGILDFGSGVTVPVGDPDAPAWVIYAYEGGLRHRFSHGLVVDVNAFLNDYREARNGAESPSAYQADERHGMEILLRAQPLIPWRIEGSYTFHEGQDRTPSGLVRTAPDLPRHTATFKSYLNIRNGWEFDTLLYYTSARQEAGGRTMPAYLRADIRLGKQLSARWNLSIWLNNLLEDVHAEEIEAFKVNTGVPRGAFLKLQYSR
ncbi:MAG: hypothetical protein D6717_12650 [Gammaproteobacteria bacterium]|nr:MAG: hypothetical protein D6717_12650 [Gammaproteobacteria bacterium]